MSPLISPFFSHKITDSTISLASPIISFCSLFRGSIAEGFHSFQSVLAAFSHIAISNSVETKIAGCRKRTS